MRSCHGRSLMTLAAHGQKLNASQRILNDSHRHHSETRESFTFHSRSDSWETRFSFSTEVWGWCWCWRWKRLFWADGVRTGNRAASQVRHERHRRANQQTRRALRWSVTFGSRCQMCFWNAECVELSSWWRWCWLMFMVLSGCAWRSRGFDVSWAVSSSPGLMWASALCARWSLFAVRLWSQQLHTLTWLQCAARVLTSLRPTE